MFGAMGLTSKSVQSAQSSAIGNTLAQETPIPTLHETDTAGGRVSGHQDQASEEQDSDRMIDQIGEMAEENDKQEETNIHDISPEERKRQEEIPRNPKKRMFEGTDVNQRDEL